MTDMFTTTEYRRLIEAAVGRFRFVRIGEHAGVEGIALWRHDVDYSPQRALALARVEAALGAVATYFVQMSSRLYSPLEPDTATVLREIARLGHDIGLHFDPETTAHRPVRDYDRRLAFEARLLEEVAETRVSAFTVHNPGTVHGAVFEGAEHGGLFNASRAGLREQFAYCSDSNGAWGYRPLAALIADPVVTRLYVLTHPEWWQDEMIPPRRRIQRCIDGRARHSEQYYDRLLERNGRPNFDA